MVRKLINTLSERIEHSLRRLCGRITPDKRTTVVLVLFFIFAAASIYMAVSSLWPDKDRKLLRIQNRIERLNLENRRLEQQLDSIRNIELFNNDDNGEE